MVRFQCENEGCRLYHKEYEYGSDEANPGRCLSCRLPMAKFLSADMGEGFSIKARCADDRNQRARDFLDATKCVMDDPFWGKGIAEIIAEAGTILDEQEIPLTGRSLFVPGYGVVEQEEDPESVKLLQEDDQRCGEMDVVEWMEARDSINKSFINLMSHAKSVKAFNIHSRLLELNREMLNIIRLEGVD